MNVKEMVGTTLAVITLMGIGYTAALKGGWIVDRANASEIAKQELSAESIERMEFQLEYKRSQLRYLLSLEVKTGADELEIAELQAQVDLLRRRIAKAKGQDE